MSWQSVPKAVGHEHVEGGASLPKVLDLAQRTGNPLPGHVLGDDGRYDFRNAEGKLDLGQFVAVYEHVAALMNDPQTLGEVIRDYGRRAAEQGAVSAELILSGAHLGRPVVKDGAGRIAQEDIPAMGIAVPQRGGLSSPLFDAAMDAAVDAARQVEQETGLSMTFQMTGVRNFGPQMAEDVARMTARYLRTHPDARDRVLSFGMAGDEKVGDLGDFKKAFEVARACGLKLRAHAGEVRGPESIEQALDQIGVDLIDHGVGSIEKPALVERLVAAKTLLTVTPTSNLMIKDELGGDITRHPLKRLYEAGVRMNISPDDGGMMNTDIANEYRLLQEKLGFTDAQLTDITLMSLEGLPMPSEDKRQALIATVLDQRPVEVVAEMDRRAEREPNPVLRERFAHWQSLAAQAALKADTAACPAPSAGGSAALGARDAGAGAGRPLPSPWSGR